MFWSLILVGIITLYLYSQRRPKNYPPGPFGIPIIGQMVWLGTRPHKKLVEWKKKFGPMVAVDFGSYKAVAISDTKLMKEMLADPNTTERPYFPAIAEARDGAMRGVIFSGGHKWLQQRRFTLRTLRDYGFGSKNMEGIIADEVKELIEIFRKESGKRINTQNKFNAGVVNALWTIINGERFSLNDPELCYMIEQITTSVQRNAFKQVALFIPWIAKMFPKLSGMHDINEELAPVIDFIKKKVKLHHKNYVRDQPRDFTDSFKDEIEKCTDPDSSFYKDEGELFLSYTIFDLFLAGSETTSTTLTWLLLYMSVFPAIQEKVRKEIHTVVGQTKFPTLNDRPNLPYLESIIFETLRMSSLIPLNLIHVSTKDIQLGGYSIPKNTLLMANLHSAHFDKDVWGDPELFRPERFITKDGKLERNENLIPFSYGKRVCLGETLARDELFLFSSAILQNFEINYDFSYSKLDLEPKLGTVHTPHDHRLILKEL